MNNKYFSVWLRELCSLIFVQSIQALVFAVILSLVVSLFAEALAGDGSNNASDYYALGVYAILAMSSIPKLELLTKRLFGLTSGVADVSMKGGGNSLRSALALGSVFKLANNIPDIAGGFVGAVGGFAASKFVGGKSTTRKVGTTGGTGVANKNLNATGGKRTISGARGTISPKKNNTKTINAGNTTGKRVKRINSASGNISDMTLGQLLNQTKSPEQQLADKKKELRQNAGRNLRRLTGGVLETMGAIGGASAGAVVGLAQGDNVINNMAIGAGLGDTVGRTINNTAYGVYDGVKGAVDTVSEIEELKSKTSENTSNDTTQKPQKYHASSGSLEKAKNVSKNKSQVKRTIKGATTMTTINKAVSKRKGGISSIKNKEARECMNKAVQARNNGDYVKYQAMRGMAAGIIKQERLSKSKQRSEMSRDERIQRAKNAASNTTLAKNQDKAIKNAINSVKKGESPSRNRRVTDNSRRYTNSSVSNRISPGPIKGGTSNTTSTNPSSIDHIN